MNTRSEVYDLHERTSWATIEVPLGAVPIGTHQEGSMRLRRASTIATFLVTLGLVIAPEGGGFGREARADSEVQEAEPAQWAEAKAVYVTCTTPDSFCQKMAILACSYLRAGGRPACANKNGTPIWLNITHQNEDDDSDIEYAVTSWVTNGDDRIREVTADDSEAQLQADIADEMARQDAWLRRNGR